MSRWPVTTRCRRWRAETRQSFQDLIDEAVADLLKKHKRPVTLKDMLRESLDQGRKRPG